MSKNVITKSVLIPVKSISHLSHTYDESILRHSDRDKYNVHLKNGNDSLVDEKEVFEGIWESVRDCLDTVAIRNEEGEYHVSK